MNQSLQDQPYQGPRPNARPPYSARSPPPANNIPTKPNGAAEDPADANRNRAARYEDEKRRIIESCFAKKDEDGVANESYITHVRVIEDGAHPSSPPPPESPASGKKSRVILVAVRRTGRVRVHKARENPNGTFSIGKTWPLEELSAILTYINLIPKNSQEQMEKQWAGGMGFVVTLGKPYYWQAPTAKEKDFFIGSLIKIYRKYTGGKVPELVGFAMQELEMLTGSTPTTSLFKSQSREQPVSSPNQPLSPPPPIAAASERRPQTPQSARSQASDPSREVAGRTRAQSRNEQPIPARDAQRPPPIEPLRSPARNENTQYGRDARSLNTSDVAPKHSLSEQSATTTASLALAGPRPSPGFHPSHTLSSPEKANGRPAGLQLPQMPYAETARSGTSSIHSAGSRPSTAVSDQRSVEPNAEQGFQIDDSLPTRPPPLINKPDSHLIPKSNAPSESGSQFATPAASPSELVERPAPTIASLSQKQAVPTATSMEKKDYFSTNAVSSSEQTGSAPNAKELHSTEDLPSVRSDKEKLATEPESTQSPSKSQEEHRPGLGPMVKKKSAKDIAGQFRRAAMAATAFQPRQGGAGARLKALQDKDKLSSEPDGITSVVPAPLLRGISSDTAKSSAPATPTTATPVTSINEEGSSAIEAAPMVQIQRSATEDSVVTPDAPLSTSTAISSVNPEPERRAPSPDKTRSRSPQRKKRQRQEAEVSKYCSALGLDSRIFDGRGTDFNDLLTEFGWEGRLNDQRRIEDFEAEIKREIGRAQATGWLGHVEQQEGKVQDLAKAFDKAIEECEELDGLFTLYSHELDTLAADIEYIEAQSQGLQVQTANQKLLQNELNSLLRTLTIPSTELRGLQTSSLETTNGAETAERSLALLYKALLTIDPDIRQNKLRQAAGSAPERTGVGVYADTEIGQMRAVRERKDDYKEAAMLFMRRFNVHMTGLFKGIDEKSLHDERQRLWRYNAMMLFVREVNSYEWNTLITTYEMSLKGTYQTQFRDLAMDQRRMVRKPGVEEMEALFTTQEKEKSDETLATTAARKLTVKRGKTIKATALRQQIGERRDGKPDAWEVFDAVLKQQSNVVSEEQNFVVCFFHLNSLANADFAEIVTSRSPEQRTLPNLSARQSYDPDRNMAKIVQGVIEGIYSFWTGDLQSLLDWALSMSPLQGVGIMYALEQNLSFYEDTNQEYITRTARTLHERLTGLFHKFVDEQIRAIEDTKVKVKKRKGLISFMRTFPIFCAAVEHMLPADPALHDTLEVRFIVNDAYSKILKAMWESLNFIAKDDPAAGGTAQSTAPTSGDPEDKEALNYQILLIENMNHYLEEVETNQNVVLDEWADKARHDFGTHLAQYTDSVIRRPLGKCLDFIESTEAMMKNSEAGGIANRPSHSRSAAKKVLSSHDNKEIRKGIETLKKRVEKHFGDVDDPTTMSRSLILRVFEDCNARYANVHDRMKTIIEQVYENNLEIDWRKEDVAAMFKR